MCRKDGMPALKKDSVRPPLLPDRHPQLDFFVCDIFDAAPKSDTASMEYPLFSLSTKPDFKPREYRNGNMWLKISPSPFGLATVHDRDILIFCISQCMAALKERREISRILRFRAHELLQVTNRSTGKRGYELFKDSLRRLQGTQIETNITTGGREQMDVFSFIDHARTVKETRDGRMEALEITLSDWLFNAISERGSEILTISRDYFRLRKPLERRLYELARKHCGTNPSWRFKVETLHERTGSVRRRTRFMRDLLKLALAAAAQKRLVRFPVAAHIHSEIARHAVEKAVFRIEGRSIALSEGQRRQEREHLVKLLIGERLDGFVVGLAT